MDTLEYFRDLSVPMVITDGIQSKLRLEEVQWLLHLCFSRAMDLKEKALDENDETLKASYLQVFDIEREPLEPGFVIKAKMIQEQPDFVTEHKKASLFNGWCGRVYVIESWNGKTENVTPDDHYITVLLPEEY